jgi:4-diphosphocytidyl-2-C-methyl-D-erythritol kinase
VALIFPAYAKLNLTLDVIGRRPNGFHDIDSVMQTISLHDLICLARTDCRVFDVTGPPIEGENLVLKAARELEGRVGRALPFTIRLFKRIPMAAGLGGGSSDAAAFLKAANKLYDLKLSTAELAEIAADVGQDVPFLLHGGTAHATGLGSTISPLPSVPANWRFLVVCPPVPVATRAVYEAVDGIAPSGRRTPALIERLKTPSPPLPTNRGPREPASGVVRGRANSAKESSAEYFGNGLEPVARKLFPALDQAIERLRAVVPTLTMTGTGAALFAQFENRVDAEGALEAVSTVGYPAWVCRPIPTPSPTLPTRGRETSPTFPTRGRES